MKWIKLSLIFVTLFSLLTMDANSQNIKNYESAWKKVEDLVKKRLPKSALEEVKKIYQLAKKENQDAQLIKSLVYITELQAENREDNEVFSVAEIEQEIESAGRVKKDRVTAILHSLLAGIYWNYYQEFRWELYGRTNTTGFKKDDLRTWSIDDFHKTISDHYQASLQPENLLQQTRLDPFDAIILKGNVRHLRPTLFDLLAHRALQYFENDERDISRPEYAFEIDQAYAFSPANEFTRLSFATRDSLSLQQKALLVYQKLLKLHQDDEEPDALIDADLKRLEFVNRKFVHPDKDQLYLKAVSDVAGKYGDLPAAAQAWYLVARYHHEKAFEYQPFGDTTNRFARVKAKEICEKVLTQKDSSEGRINCYNLLQQIIHPSLQFSVEKVNVPAQPLRASVKYKNITRLHLRLIRASEAFRDLMDDPYDDDYWDAVVNAIPIRTWEQDLPQTNDLQEHRAEIKIDGLPHGEYVLIAGTEKNFSSDPAIMGARLFYVSNISYVNDEDDYFVLNRETGQPLANAAVQIWERKYNYEQSKNTLVRAGQYKTDANGFFRKQRATDPVSKRNTYSSFLIDITHQDDRLFMNDQLNDYYYYRDGVPAGQLKATSVFLFTDRGLYRPGQTVYFKGIVLDRIAAEKKAWANENYNTTVYLRDANYQDIDSLSVKTNEFGSFSGKFQLPQAGLNGHFSLYTKKDNGSAGFNVEEYKRPKFFVDYEPLKGTYQLNDTIVITGIAKAYAGNNIDGAQVKYRVVRQPRFLYPWLFWRGWLPPSAPMEIAHGETKTDANGNFTVSFRALPDLKIDRKLEPVFDYSIYADVTDINGETRSGEQRLTVGYKSLLIKTDIPKSLEADSLKSLTIRTENMNGEFAPSAVTVTITKLQPENRLIRDRYWERPDQFVMTREKYIQLFPHDEYDNETDPKTWAKAKIVFEKQDSAQPTGIWPVEIQDPAPGIYAIEIFTKDKNGELVKDLQYIELYDPTNRQPGNMKYLSASGAALVEPGETTTINLGSSADKVFMIHQVDKSQENVLRSSDQPNLKNKYHFVNLNNEQRSFSFKPTEADRGGFGVSWIFVKHNRVHQYSQIIRVPWTNKELNVEYATYRDKTLPGSEEKWTLRITGDKKEKLAAEMLAGMYDASLDQFYPFKWRQPAIWPEYHGKQGWDQRQNFTWIESHPKPDVVPDVKHIEKTYDQILPGLAGEIIAYGYATKRSRRDMLLKEVAMAAPAPDLQVEAQFTDSAASMAPAGNEDSGVIEESASEQPKVQVRKNFNETAFFLPDLKTDSTGAISFSFTLPEALTQWKFQALVHTREAALGYSSKEIVTQKQLMVQPNPPRFLREGDRMELSAKIVNVTNTEFTGQAELQLFDATTNQPVDGWFSNMAPTQFFTVAAGRSESVRFPIVVPFQFNRALVWRIVARAGEYSDGEEDALPVLTNRMLVTETLPLPMKGTGTKTFNFEKLLKSGDSETLQHHALTVEYTSNPAWFAIQSLPYLMEYPYDCAEQTWNRYYANSLAAFITGSSPRIRQVFEQWKTKDTAALLSNLQKNEELKSILLEETPWVLQAKSESEQKKNIALLFDLVRMKNELNSSYEKLKHMQSSNGGFVWFKGGPDDRYMTQYIVTGIGHLKKIGALANGQKSKLDEILVSAIPYLDRKLKEDYDNLVKYKTDLKKYQPSNVIIQYLYMRSFFPEVAVDQTSRKAVDYFRGRAQQTWTSQNKYMQGMLSLALHRTGDVKTPAAILASLKETAVQHEELGMYWKDARRGWFWHEAPIERQSLLIEAFQEIGKDQQAVSQMRTWLLRNKQTNRWESTKATAEACYALLLQGTDWLKSEPNVEIRLGNTVFSSSEQQQEAGTGYFKKVFEPRETKPEMGRISVSVQDPANSQQPSFGAVYWQYFEDLDKITTSATPLNLSRKLFVEKNTDTGPVLTPVNEGDFLNVGDKLKVRIELRVDRDMEYVHMKDLRAAALEPVNVLSSYKWQGGLGYYETTKDASTNFFFNQLRKGTYVFEYALFITHAGSFSNGITSIQSMYAPEFSAHSEGIRINVE